MSIEPVKIYVYDHVNRIRRITINLQNIIIRSLEVNVYFILNIIE